MLYAEICRSRRFSKGWVTLSANFRRKGASPTNPVGVRKVKTKMIALSCGIKTSAVHCLVCHKARVWQTDGRADGQNYDSQDCTSIAASCGEMFNWFGASRVFSAGTEVCAFRWVWMRECVSRSTSTCRRHHHTSSTTLSCRSTRWWSATHIRGFLPLELSGICSTASWTHRGQFIVQPNSTLILGRQFVVAVFASERFLLYTHSTGSWLAGCKVCPNYHRRPI